MVVLGLDEYYMERFNDFVGGPVVATVRFGVFSVPNQDTFFRSLEYLGIVFVQNKNEGL